MESPTVRLTIDGNEVHVAEGMTVLEAARQHGIYIPTLCYHPSLAPIGSCRLCVVEIEGAEHSMTACTTLAQEGMNVRTQSALLEQIRRDALKLILTYHPLDCPQCDAGGWCELQRLVFEFGIDAQEYRASRRERGMNEFATPLINQWGDRCVMCLRCIRADHEIVRTHAIDLVGKGLDAEVGIMNPGACISCGECLRVCPVGALTETVSRVKARVWQGRTVATTCVYCSLGCQMNLRIFEGKVVGVTTDTDVGTNKGSLCVRGKFGYELMGAEGRLTRPLMRKNDVLVETRWEEALSHVAAMLNTIALEHGPESIGGLVSPRATNEEVYLFQKFMRRIVGTHNIDTSGRLCVDPYRQALKEVAGVDCLHCTLDELAESDCIIMAGGDLDEDNLLIAANVVRKALWRGARLIILHPKAGRLAGEADHWLCVRPGDESIVVNGLMHLLLQSSSGAEVGQNEVKGSAELKETVTTYTPAFVESQTGVPAHRLEDAARSVAAAQRPAVICSPPLGQQVDGVDQMRAMMNLALLTGAVGKGCGIHLVGPQSNMRGAVEMGGVPGLLPGYRPADSKGLSMVEMFRAAAEGRLKALYVAGENPLVTLPRVLVDEALKALTLLIVQEAYPSEFTERAHVVLPSASFGEVDGTYTNCEGKIQRVRKAVDAPDGVRWAGEVWADLTGYMGKEMAGGTPAEVFATIKNEVSSFKDAEFETGHRPGTTQPLASPDGAGLCPVEVKKRSADLDYPFFLTIEGVFYNHLLGSGGQLRSNGLARLNEDAVMQISAEAARRMGIEDGGKVAVVTESGRLEVKAKCVERMHDEVLWLYLSHYQVDAARLVGPICDRESMVPVYSGIPARIEKD